ncbi:hypothetical protein HZA43_01835 [Candidatus Peregrinibacteria bacterium]|nr:hypothetical protein [Candidatus Peregrinibacteria bacterium]
MTNFQFLIFNRRRGSILIWTVTIGLALTTAFFFLAVRLGVMRDAQRDTIAYHSQKAYLESYVAYLKAHPPGPVPSLDFDGIKASMTRQPTIDGVLDSGAGTTLDLSGSGDLGTITVHWNLCGEEAGDLMIVTDPPKPHGGASCPSGEYADSFQLLSSPPPSFLLRSMNAPLHYRITHSGTGAFNKAKWALHAEIPVGNFGKKIEMDEVF